MRLPTMGRFAPLLWLAFVACGPGTPPSPPPPPLPDLRVYEIRLDAANTLIVSIVNTGNAEVPQGLGNAVIFVDGLSLGGYAFGNLVNQSWRKPGGILEIKTNFKLSGKERQIAVHLDTQNKVQEVHEAENRAYKTVVPAQLTGADIELAELSVSGGFLSILVKNVGNAPTPEGASIHFQVQMNGVASQNITFKSPSIPPNGMFKYIPSPLIVVPPSSLVSVSFAVQGFTELDNTRNSLSATLPGGPSLALYTPLLNDPIYTEAMIWESSQGKVAYKDWTAAQRSDLQQAILRVENGQTPGFRERPAYQEDKYLDEPTAWKIYLAHVAFSLWGEAHGHYPWKIKDYTLVERVNLLAGYVYFKFDPDQGAYFHVFSHYSDLGIFDPQVAWRFMYAEGLVGSDAKATVLRVTDHLRAHFRHADGNLSDMEIYGQAGPPSTGRILYPPSIGQSITKGCWFTTAIYAELLRVVNIPVLARILKLGGDVHSRPEFSSIGLSMTHADNPYSRYNGLEGPPLPTVALMYTLDEIETQFDKPIPQCDEKGCPTQQDQADQNMGRLELQRHHLHRTYKLPLVLAEKGEDVLDKVLTGNYEGGILTTYWKPYFNAAERAQMIAEVKQWLTEYGGGDIEVGKARIQYQVASFSNLSVLP